jgi:outer membrane protein OmpU
MKKILLGTTGLIGAALLSAAANAETPKVTLGGFADFQAGYTSDDADTDLRGTAFRNDNEVSVRVDGKTDGGLGYGAVIDIEADITDDVNAEGTNAARTFTYLEGSWGRFEMGGNKSAAESMRVDASSIAVATGGIDGDWTYFVNDAAGDLAGSGGFITTPALVAEHGSTTLLNNEATYNASKITYFSPLFAGFQVGASYTPDLEARGQTVNRTETASFGEVLDLGVSFNHQFDNAWKLGAAFTYETADSEVAATEDVAAWNIGAHVGFMGFAVAASYGDWDDSATAVAGSVESDYYTLGASYETGPFGLSATWLQSEVDSGATENEFENLVIGADYKLAPGLTPYAEVSFYEFDEAGTGAGVYDNDGTTFLLGTQIAF